MKSKVLENNIFYFLIFTLILAIVFLFLLSVSVSAEVINEDKPEKGTGTFNISELWQVEEGEGNPFGNIRSILVSDNGILCCLDDKLKRLFLFDKNGKLLKGFGKKGEGPGEIKLFRQAGLYNAGDKIAIQDSDRIHYFNWNGDFIESKSNIRSRNPILFLSQYEFITAPRNILAAPGGVAEVKKIDLKNSKEILITKFSMYKGGAIQNTNSRAAIVANGLTPLFELGKHGDRLYYGVSDKYNIEVSDMKGNVINSFSLRRGKKSVTEEEKAAPILRGAKGLAPEELLRNLAKKLPNEETYFIDIKSHNDQIWVYVTNWNRSNSFQIDIFSLNGKYLYKRFVKIDEGESIRLRPLVHGNTVFLVILNEDDESRIAKYKIVLPE